MYVTNETSSRPLLQSTLLALSLSPLFVCSVPQAITHNQMLQEEVYVQVTIRLSATVLIVCRVCLFDL